jgi:phospholipase C
MKMAMAQAKQNHSASLARWRPPDQDHGCTAEQRAFHAGRMDSFPQYSGALGRCGYGPRLPLLVISLCARRNFVDHTITDQTSIIRFVEDNWLDGQPIGNGSFDAIAGSLTGMFDFDQPHNRGESLLEPTTGEVVTNFTNSTGFWIL